jgi:hypothetical protein
MQPDDIPMPGSPDSGIPLADGLDPEWNSVLGAVPEDKRTEVATYLKDWNSKYTKLQEDYTPWAGYKDKGYDPKYMDQAVTVMDALTYRPEEVYEAMKKHFGPKDTPTPQPVEPTTEPSEGVADITQHPEFQRLKKIADMSAQVLLADRQTKEQSAREASEAAKLDEELGALKKKFGEDIPEKEIVMRMATYDMTAEEAYKDFAEFATTIRKKPAPFVLGSGGPIPREPIDPRKMTSEQRSNLFAQFLDNQS